MQAPNLEKKTIRQLVRTRSLEVDAFELYRCVTDDDPGPGQALLESLDAATQTPCRSFVVDRVCLRIVARGSSVRVESLNSQGRVFIEALGGESDSLEFTFEKPSSELTETERIEAPSAFDILRRVRDVMPVESSHEPGLLMVGSFAFDAIDLIEELPQNEDLDGIADFEFFVADRFFVADHRASTVSCFADVVVPEDPEEALEHYHDATRDIRRLSLFLERVAQQEYDAHRDDQRREAPSFIPATSLEVDLGDAEFAALVDRVVADHIETGDVFQAVLSRTFTTECETPLAAYARLRQQNPSPYMFYVPHAEHLVFGASPETCVAVDADRRVTIKPIAGTRPRGRGHDADDRQEASLRLDEKEQAEHMMLVDLARNDVARISRSGTRRVSRLLEVERYSHVMHLVSEVTGELAEGLDSLHAYAACMNMGTLVGAPKLRATEIIRRYEASKRGFYGGAVGYLTSEDVLDTAIVIRSAVIADGKARVRAGAGIVHDSNARSETIETRNKAAAVLEALGLTPAQLEEQR